MKYLYLLPFLLSLFLFAGFKARAQSALVNLPYAEHFSSPGFPAGWSQHGADGLTTGNWAVANTSKAGGAPYEMRAQWQFAYGTSRLVTPPVNTAGVYGIVVNFRHYYADLFPGTRFLIQSSSDLVNWTDANWSFLSGGGDLGPEQVTTLVADNLGDSTYIAFVIKDDHYQFIEWEIDNVELTALQDPPTCMTYNYPYSDETDVPTNTTLRWDPSPLAADYLLYLGTDYPPGNMYNGIAPDGESHHVVTNLLPGTKYYWQVVPSNDFGQPAGCVIDSFTTIGAVQLPYSESFSDFMMPPGWIEQDSSAFAGWYASWSNLAGGQPMELRFDYQASTGLARIVTPPIHAAGQLGLWLACKQYFRDDYPGLKIKVQSSQDAVHWTDEGFEHLSGSGNLGPLTDTIPITHNMCGHTYVGFVLEGDLNAFYYWTVDDIVFTTMGEAPGVITGTVRYGSNAQTPMANVSVFLKDSAMTVVDTVLTAADGSFSFPPLVAGPYSVSCSTPASWGGGNAIDALLIMKHFAGMSSLQGMRLLAADVDNSGNINAVDALLVMQRFVGAIFSFALPDWLFETPEFTVYPGETTTLNLHGICTGDVDASYIPPN